MPTTTTSTVGPVCAALVTSLTSSLTGVQVADGRPADMQLAREVVYLGDITGEESIPVMKSGRKPYEQRYTIEVVCAVAPARGFLSTARTRCEELRDEIRNIVADDPTIGDIAGVLTVTLGGFRQNVDYAGEGPLVITVQDVEVLARVN